MTVSSTELVDALRTALSENERLRTEHAALVERAREPIAVIAMGCRLPGGVRSPDDLWELVEQGVDGTSEIPDDRSWKRRLEATLEGEYRPRGGFVAGIDRFDPSLFGISPREATAMDPQQRLLLETAWETFEHAGIVPATLRGSATGVFVGGATTGYGISPDSVPEGFAPYMVTGTSPSVISGRVAYTFGLEGPVATLDTACSSSLVALHQAVVALRRRECDLALAGGVSIMSTAGTFQGFSGYGVTARDGRCKSFSRAADGAGWSEGAGLLLVERLSDARRHGHPVLALIRGIAVNSDGASNGLTAPNGPSQQRVIRAALADAGLTPDDVDVVEAHGTGTQLGDPIEAQALQATYGRGRTAEWPLLLGSLKSNIGHAQAASGVAGVAKTVLSLVHAHVPASLFGDEPSPHIEWEGGGVEVCGTARAWPRRDRPRRAAVSSFGISGTNAHVVVEQAPEPESPGNDGHEADVDNGAGTAAPRVLGEHVPLLVSAARPDTLAGQANALADLLECRPELSPAAVAAGTATLRTAFGHRGVVVVRDREQAVGALRALAAREPAPGLVTAAAATPGKVAFVFSGQGGQSVGMARELIATSPAFAAALADCDRALAPWLPCSITDVLTGDDETWLDRVEIVQPALWAVMVALARLWQAHGLTPTAVVGHSQGEIAAACVAGALSLDDGARVVVRRAAAIAEHLAGSGAMASVALPAVDVAERLAEAPDVHVAALNGPTSTVVAGPPAAVEGLVAACVADGARATMLPVDYASHTEAVDALREPLLADLAPVRPTTGTIPFFSTVTIGWTDPATLDAGYWFDNLRKPVRLDGTVAALRAEGYTAFVEVSPHPVLAADVSARLEADSDPAESTPVVVSTLRRDEDAAHRFGLSVAEALARGFPIDRAALFAGVDRVPATELPAYAFATDRYWLDPVAGAPGDVAGAGLRAADHPLLGAVTAVAGRDEYVLTGQVVGGDTARGGWSANAEGASLPTVALMEAMLRAADEVGALGLREVHVEPGGALRPGEPRDLQVVLGAADGAGDREVTVHLRAGADWVQQARAVATRSGLPPVPPASAVGRDTSTVGIEDAHEAAEAARYVLHPALVAGAVAQALDNDPKAVTLTAADAVTVLRGGATDVRVATTPKRVGDEAIDLVLVDPADDIVAVLSGVRVAATAMDTADDPDPAAGRGERTAFAHDWVACPDCSPLISEGPNSGTPRAPSTPGRWVTIGPDGRDAAGALRAAGLLAAEAPTVAALDGLTDGLVPDRVLLDVGAPGPEEDALADRARGVAGATLEAVQAMLAEPGWEHVTLVAVTRGAVRVEHDDEVVDAGAATAWGLLGSAAAEHPGRVALLDLPAAAGTDPTETVMPTVPMLERAAVGDEPRLALRAGQLRAARLRPLDRVPNAAPRAEAEVHPDGAVLVTGGTGVLGALVARHLVLEHGTRHVVLLGRRGADAPGARDLVTELGERGATVEVRACDVSDPAAVTALLADLADADIPVTTVVHAAGTLADGALTGLTPESLDTVLAPKVGGLTALLDGCPQARFVLFSSIAGVLGSPGQANYAAANAVLDAVAQRLDHAGRPVRSLAWGLWAPESGMTADFSEVSRRRLAAIGTREITTDEGLALLDAALAPGDDGPAARTLFPLDPSAQAPADPASVPALFRALVPLARPRAAAAGQAGPTGHGLADRLATTPPSRRLGVVLGVVRAEVEAVLGYADGTVPTDRPYLELGLDSITMLDLRNRLGAAVGAPIAATALYDHPTPAATATWLLSDPLGPDLTDAGEPLEPDGRPEPDGRRGAESVGTAPARDLARVDDDGEDDPVVIAAMALRVPGGVETPEAFWTMLETGSVGVGRFPDDRGWDRERLESYREMLPGIDIVTGAGFLSGASGFDPEFFGVTPEEALVMDPQQRLLLELAWETFERAGSDPGAMAGTRTGVFIGTFVQNYIGDLRRVPEGSESYVSTSSGAPFACARVAYTLGLDGPTLTVDTGCSSSGIALHLAAQAVRAGDCTSALVGGVTVMAFPMAFPDLGGVSSDGRCRSFSADADGTGWSEGAGMVLVERLSEARRRGHPVLATVRGSAVNHNGSSNGLAAPNAPSQRTVIERALAAASLAPADVDAVEAHGTGTPMGDEIEAEALIGAYGGDRGDAGPLLLGSMKGSTGHPNAASGVLEVIAATLALRHDTLPPVAYTDHPFPRLDGSNGVLLRTKPTPWPRLDRPRRIGVSAFGASGSKAHLVLEQALADASAPPPPTGGTGSAGSTELAFPLSAGSPAALAALAGQLGDALAGDETGETDEVPAMRDVAHTLGAARSGLVHRAVVRTDDREKLRAALAHLAAGTAHPQVRTGIASEATGTDVLALAFPGDDPGVADGASALLSRLPAFAAGYAEITEHLGRHLGRELDPDGDTELTAFATHLGAARALAALGLVPDVVVGAGRGELAAAAVGGLLAPDDAAALAVAAATGRAAPVTVTPRLPRVPCVTATGADIAPGTLDPGAGDLAGHAVVTVRVDPDGLHVTTPESSGPADGLLAVLADAYRHGVAVDWAAAPGARGGAVVDLPTYPFQNRPFWLGADGEEAPPSARVEPDEQVRKDVVTEYYRRLNAGDIEGVVAMFAPDGRIEDPIGHPPAEGHDALRRFFEVTIGRGDIHDTIERVVTAHDGRHVAVAVTADMINVEDPDGGRMGVEAIMTFQVDGRGLITEARTFWGIGDVTFPVAAEGAGGQDRL